MSREHEWFRHVQVGIPPQKDEPKDINEMRQQIERARRQCSIIRSALDAASFRGLSGEDKYALLAYYALRQLNTMHKINTDFLMSTPPGPIIVKKLGVP